MKCQGCFRSSDHSRLTKRVFVNLIFFKTVFVNPIISKMRIFKIRFCKTRYFKSHVTFISKEILPDIRWRGGWSVYWATVTNRSCECNDLTFKIRTVLVSSWSFRRFGIDHPDPGNQNRFIRGNKTLELHRVAPRS